MNSKIQHPRLRSLALSCVLQSVATVCVLGSAEAQVSSPFEQTVSGAAGSWQFFPLDIPAGTTSLQVKISGGTGDADLYVRPGEQPTDSEYACRPFRDGNEEACDQPTPQAGRWHLALNAWTDFTAVTITATWAGPQAPNPEPTAGLTPWQNEMLDRHNLLRAKHCSPAMTWDEEIAKSAQAWADRCRFEHAQGTGLGENLAAAAGTVRTPTETSDSWYSEIQLYNFAAPGTVDAAGHFTQLVWKGSTKLGCAMAVCPATSISPNWGAWPTAQLVVCRYAPQGNVAGAYAENVLPESTGGVCD